MCDVLISSRSLKSVLILTCKWSLVRHVGYTTHQTTRLIWKVKQAVHTTKPTAVCFSSEGWKQIKHSSNIKEFLGMKDGWQLECIHLVVKKDCHPIWVALKGVELHVRLNLGPLLSLCWRRRHIQAAALSAFLRRAPGRAGKEHSESCWFIFCQRRHDKKAFRIM